MSNRGHLQSLESKAPLSQISVEDALFTDLPPEKQGTAIDRRDMARMGKQQEFRVSQAWDRWQLEVF